MKPELSYVIYVGTEPQKVWDALVSPEGVKAIFFGCALDTTFEIGAPYRYIGPGSEGDETVHVYGNILAFEQNKVMSYTEHPGPSYNENHANLETRVTLTLDQVGNSTKVTLINDEWPDDHPSYERTRESWPIIMSNVKTYAETGKTMDMGF
ncbi:SRPBCC domain-containing protein [Paenibacillus sp. HB172176]|uniref:SRPBCC domain-containing protein n=1 Tax=Paenibacillus sp. HB172176 TaxID=2493690 RepID=UPI00143CB65A|nr:SRPBCC domain-containing protein [Paenibacillus sp. HB172176]